MGSIKRFLRSTTGWAIILCLLAVIISGALPWITKTQTSEWKQPSSSGNWKISWPVRGVDGWPGAVLAGVSLAVVLLLIATGFNDHVARWQSFLVILTGIAALTLVGIALWVDLRSSEAVVSSTGNDQSVTTTSSSIQFGTYAACACALTLAAVGVLQFRASSKYTVVKSDYTSDEMVEAAGPQPVTDWEFWKSDWRRLFRTPASWAKVICILGLAASLLPWAQVLWLVLNGFSTWLGMTTTGIYLLLLVFLGMSETGERFSNWRPFVMMLTGVAIGALSVWFLRPFLFPPQLTNSQHSGAESISEPLLRALESSLSIPIGPIINLCLGISLLVLSRFDRRTIVRASAR